MLRRKFFTRDSSPLGAKYYMGVLRTGNSVSTDVGTGFSPDLVIGKKRNGAVASAWFSRVRGALKRLITSSTNPEVVDTNTLTAFTPTGFTLGADTPQVINAPNIATFIYWCFNKAPEFLDVVDFIGDGNLSKTINHDLTIPPELAIGKSRTGTQLWPVMHKDVGGRDLVFNTNAAATIPSGNTKITAGTQTAEPWRGICYGNGVYVAICKGNANCNRVAVSTDGQNWTEHVIAGMPTSPTFTTGLFAITFFTTINKFVAIGNLCSYTSSDGQTWTKGPDQANTFSSAPEQCLASGGGKCVFLDAGDTATSTDGLNWTWHPGVLSTHGSCITWDNGSFVILPTNNNTTAHWSDDGLTWSNTGVPQAARGWRQVKGNGSGTLVGVGTLNAAVPGDRTNQMVRSTDSGRTWQTISFATTQSWGGLAYGNGVFLAGGADTNNADDQSNIINVSFDMGATWSAKSLVQTAYWMFWAYGNAGFVGLSYGVDTNLNAQVQIESGSAWIKNPQPLTIDVGSAFNVLGAECEIALFGSKPKVSKIGVYNGNGILIDIDCGFDAPARFVMIKRWNAAGNWYVWDSARGINTGTNDPYLIMNSNLAEAATDNALEPIPTGFRVNQSAGTAVNASGGQYIYLAIA